MDVFVFFSLCCPVCIFFFFSSRRRHTRSLYDWSSDVCSSDLCGEGQCGACTVLLDGVATRSCITQVGRATGKQITTIEGLEKDGKLTPLQEAFIKADAMQCAYCTSGMLMSASALLSKNPKPSRDEIVTGMNGNVCRCGTYQRIIEAIQNVSVA